ncbi:hypothetical protein [Allosphingosinicella sp.]|uniref:hypothetical protein n=1 Tax=Allosphingosinicella sp. TaxID=2823234 RepID=UPI002F164639
MESARWSRPSCIVILLLLAAAIGILVWLIFGSPARTPSPTSITTETPTYDTDVPAAPPRGR